MPDVKLLVRFDCLHYYFYDWGNPNFGHVTVLKHPWIAKSKPFARHS